jgi:flagellar biosynthesis protein FlhF
VRQPLHSQPPIQTRAQPIEVPVQRFNTPERPAAAAHMPQPIRTRNSAPPAFEDSTPPRLSGNGGHNAPTNVELTALKDMIEERFNTLAWLGSSKQHPIQSNLMLKLIRSGYSPAMARAVIERVSVDASPAEAVRWVMEVITRNLKVAAPGAGLCDEGGVISLIGATGVGKTTTAAKLAAQCVKQFGAGSVGLITLDSYRVSGYEQLRAYGRLMGVVAHLAHDRAALKDLLSLLANKRMVIIDTAGLGQRDQRIQDMLDMLDVPNVKKVLVLNAGAHGDTIDDVLTSFQSRSLHGVVLSKVDEAVKLGPAIDALIRHQVVLRGVANGQRVPEDWQNPDAATLVRMSMGSQSKSAYDPQSSDLGLYFSQISTRGIDLGGAHV